MKKIIITLIFVNFSFSQVEVDNFNIDGDNQIPGQYIVYEFDNLSEDELYLGINFWLQRENQGRTGFETFPNKRGFLIKDQLMPLPFGYKYQNKLGRRLARGIEFRYQINIKDNKVRFFLESINASNKELNSSSIVGTGYNDDPFSLYDDDFNSPIIFGAEDLYLDVKLRDLKYKYTINGFDQLIKTINRRASSLKNFLDNFSISDENIVGNFEYKKVDLFSLNERNQIFPYQYREFDVDGYYQMELISNVWKRLKSISNANFRPILVHSFLDEERDIFYQRFNLTSKSGANGGEYWSVILLYNNNKLRFILDNIAFANEVILGDSDTPKGQSGSYSSNINNIWVYASGRNELTPTNWSWEEIDDYQTGFYFRPNGKVRKSIAKSIEGQTNYFNLLFEDLKQTVEETVFVNDDW
jgi:hypothetical protein